MVAASGRTGRKVRAPQGMMLANGEGEKSHGKCHRKENARTDAFRIRSRERFGIRPSRAETVV